MNSIIYALLLVTVLAVNGEDAPAAASCYVCNSITEAGCNDPFSGKSDYVQECTKGETFCRKVVQTVNGENSIIRQCAKELYKNEYEGCYKTAGKASQQVCTCRAKDGKPCNSAFTTQSSAFLVASIVLAAVLLK
jgi:hypothetical protein